MALTKPRDTLMRGREILVIPVAAGVVIHEGGLTAVNAAGLAVPGSTAVGLKAAGRAENSKDNTGGADGAQWVTVRRGVFRFKNAAADPIVQGDLLADCYIVDDETVAKTSGANTRSRAGKVIEIEATGVWVEF